jgi:hypothetical protein
MTRQIQHAIIQTRQGLHLDREQWQHWAIFLARFYLYAAPEKVRIQFIGIPSETPSEIKNLAEIFALLYAKAEDQAQVTRTKYRIVDLWSAALQLQEAHHE